MLLSAGVLVARTWGTATTVKPNTTILHSRQDETVPIADSLELLKNSDLPSGALSVVGTEHRLADEESLKAMLRAVEAGLLRTMLHSSSVESGLAFRAFHRQFTSEGKPWFCMSLRVTLQSCCFHMNRDT